MSKKRVAEAFNRYLVLGGIPKDKIHPIQLREMERAFYAGMGGMWVELTTTIPSQVLNPAMANSIAQEMVEEMKEFWIVEQQLDSVALFSQQTENKQA